MAALAWPFDYGGTTMTAYAVLFHVLPRSCRKKKEKKKKQYFALTHTIEVYETLPRAKGLIE